MADSSHRLRPSGPTAMPLTRKQQDILLKVLNKKKIRSPKEARMRRKLLLRRHWQDAELEPFNIDHQINAYISDQSPLELLENGPSVVQIPLPKELASRIRSTKFQHSFASRIYGKPSSTASNTASSISPFDGKRLAAFIRRDDTCRPLRALLLQQLCSQEDSMPSIDYCYMQPQHLAQVNELLQRTFWPGINAAENLDYPNYSVIALYKRLVVGCALMTPDAYISYVAVSSGWEGSGIGQFMIYHLMTIQSNIDLTLHVSANNNAMLLYQKFGFKPEEYIVNFYEKYLPAESIECKNAMLIRRRR